MTRRRLLASIAIPLVWIAACTFPDVSFGPGSGINGSEAGVDGAGPLPEAGPVPPVSPDASVDATVVPEGGGHVDEAGCGATPCDCDGDQVDNSSAGCNHDGGIDCDDFNRFINPNASWTASPWDPLSQHTPAGDWNCDGNAEKLIAEVNVKCNDTSSKAACEHQGFAHDPACGEYDDYVVCVFTPGSVIPLAAAKCEVGSSTSKPQSCR